MLRYGVTSGDSNPAVEVAPLHAGRDYRAVVIDSNTLQLKRNDVLVNLEVDYFRDASDTVSLIRTDGQDWRDDGFGFDFAEGETIIISNSDHDGTYSIIGYSGDTLTLGNDVSDVDNIKATRFVADIDFDPAVSGGLNDTITPGELHSSGLTILHHDLVHSSIHKDTSSMFFNTFDEGVND